MTSLDPMTKINKTQTQRETSMGGDQARITCGAHSQESRGRGSSHLSIPVQLKSPRPGHSLLSNRPLFKTQPLLLPMADTPVLPKNPRGAKAQVEPFVTF